MKSDKEIAACRACIINRIEEVFTMDNAQLLSSRPKRELAIRYGVHRDTIRDIKHGKTWIS